MATRYNNEVYAIIGARNHERSGSAYLISYDTPSMTWEHVAEFIPGGASANGGFEGSDEDSSYDQFGFAVDISQDWVAIAAPLDTASTGKVSLFWLDDVTSGGQLEPDTEIVADDKQFQTRFGSSLAFDGNTLVVGAARDRAKVGSVYIFKYSGGQWVQVAKLEPDDVSSDSQGNFGHVVAAAQGVVAVGAPFDGTQGRRRNGSVYVYEEVGSSGSYELLQKVVPSDLLGGDQFGYAIDVGVSTNPSTNAQELHLAVGTRFDDDKGQDSGSVYMYKKGDGGSFSFEQKLVPFEWSPGYQMGSSVSMDGERIIVGAKEREDGGGAYYFQYEGGTWVDKGVITPTNAGGGIDDEYGSAVALTSDVMLIGSYLNDANGEDSGTIYSYAVCN